MLYERRRDLRYPIQLAAVFSRNLSPVLTEDVSYRGLLLRADAALTLGQLYRLEVRVSEGAPIHLHLVPVRWLDGASGAHARIGARLLGHEPRWQRFVGDLQALTGRPIVAARRIAPELPVPADRLKGVG